jgi:ATP-dependent helicase/nuclease subunit A
MHVPGDLPMRALTSEQELAVARREGSMLLSAAAGSGKTSVLAERFVRAVCEDGIAPGRILAITFTERAAAELKHRVRARLRELGERDFALATESAFVSTFHSFCAHLLRAHPIAAQVTPGFQIIERASSERLQRLAFRGALAALLEREGERAVDLLAAYGADPLRRIVLGTYAHLRSRGELEPRLPAPTARVSPGAAARELARAIEEAREELNVAFEQRPGPRLSQALDAIGRARELLAEGSWEPPAGRPPPPAALIALRLPSANGALDGRGCDAYRDALARCIQACADRSGVGACLLLDRLLGDFGERYARIVQGRGSLDFDDLELRARVLIESHEDIRKSWSERFQLLMVDEFQDTNARQLAILRALDRDNLFTVGDELQSIYGFREADVEIFRARRTEMQRQGGCLELTGNFRARPPLIAAVNAVFAERFGARYTPLVAAREDASQEASQAVGEPPIELLLTDSAQRCPKGGARLWGARAWRLAEADLLARRICELVAGGQARAGEIVVLLRATSELALYERALQDHGLNTSASAGRFWEGQQVGDLLCYLRALANPYDELALCATLCSPLVGISTDGLVALAALARQQRVCIWDAISPVGADRGGGLSELDRGRLENFLERFRRERASAPWRSVGELLERAIEWTRYELHVLSLHSAERRMANVHKLVRLARRFAATESPGLREFLDHAEQLRERPDGAEAEAVVAVGEIDAVRLMSIHAAKGLEFPVVCLADLGRAPRTSSTPALLVGGERLGLRLATLDGTEPASSLHWEELARERRSAEAEEEERIFYVGMTRASERLILSGAVDFEHWPKPRASLAPVAWIVPALVQEMPLLEEAAQHPLQRLACRDAPEVAVRCTLARPAGAIVLDTPVEPAIERPRSSEACTEQARAGQGIAGQQAAGQQAAGQQAAGRRTPAQAMTAREEPGGSWMRRAGRGTPSTFSYTALGELERCGYRFYLERVLGLSPQRRQLGEGAGALGARQRGTILHRLLEELDFARTDVCSPQRVQAVCEQLGLSVSAGEREAIAVLVGRALESELAGRLGRISGLRREYPFVFSLGAAQRLLSGVLDAVAIERSGTLIVDYKSDHLDANEDLGERVERDYLIQRQIYALAALGAGERRVEVVPWFLERPEEPVNARFMASERAPLEARLGERIGRAEAAGFSVSAEPHRALCAGCPGQAGLCSWSQAETSRELPR